MAPPIISAAPTLIDSVAFSTASKVSYGFPPTAALGGNAGLKPWIFRFSGSIYFMVLQSATVQNLTTGAGGVFMSTTGAAGPWTRQDAANQPALGSALSCHYPGGNTIYVAFANGAGAIFTSTIALTATGATWGVPSSAAPTLVYTAPGSKGAIHIAALSTGDVYVFVTISTGAKAPLHMLLYSGGAWTGPTTISADTAAIFCNVLTVVTDSSDQTLVLYENDDSTGTPTITLNWVSVIGGVASAPAIALTAVQLGGLAVVAGSPVVFNGDFKVPVFFRSASGTQMQMLTVTALPAPTFSLDASIDPGASTVPSPAELGGPMPTVIDSLGRLWCFWVVANTTDDAAPQQVWGNVFSTSWGLPVLFYDYALNPPGGSALFGSGIGEYIQGLSVAPGSFVFHAMMPLSLAQQVAGFALLAPLGPGAGTNITLGLKGMKVYPVGSGV